jgi:hypothetical protein
LSLLLFTSPFSSLTVSATYRKRERSPVASCQVRQYVYILCVEMDTGAGAEAKHIRHRGSLPLSQNEFDQNGNMQEDPGLSKREVNRRRRRPQRIYSRFSVRRIRAYSNRFLLHVKRNPRLLFAYAVGAFLCLLFISTWLTLVIYYRLNKVEAEAKVSGIGNVPFSPDIIDVHPDSDTGRKLPTSRKFDAAPPEKVAPSETVVSRPSTIVFPTTILTEKSVLLPDGEWDTGYGMESPDYNGLDIWFFLEDGSQRNIFADTSFSQNDFYDKRIDELFDKEAMDG